MGLFRLRFCVSYYRWGKHQERVRASERILCVFAAFPCHLALPLGVAQLPEIQQMKFVIVPSHPPNTLPQQGPVECSLILVIKGAQGAGGGGGESRASLRLPPCHTAWPSAQKPLVLFALQSPSLLLC